MALGKHLSQKNSSFVAEIFASAWSETGHIYPAGRQFGRLVGCFQPNSSENRCLFAATQALGP